MNHDDRHGGDDLQPARRVFARADGHGAGEDTPRRLKVIAAVSIVSWFMVLYWGRMLPSGTAF